MFLKCTKFACVLSCFNCVWLFETLWSVACQAPLSLGFSRQEYWSELSCPPPGDLPDPGFDLEHPASLALQESLLTAKPLGKPIKKKRFGLKKKQKTNNLIWTSHFRAGPHLEHVEYHYFQSMLGSFKKLRLQKPNSLNIIILQTYSW